MSDERESNRATTDPVAVEEKLILTEAAAQHMGLQQQTVWKSTEELILCCYGMVEVRQWLRLESHRVKGARVAQKGLRQALFVKPLQLPKEQEYAGTKYIYNPARCRTRRGRRPGGDLAGRDRHPDHNGETIPEESGGVSPAGA